MEKDLELTIEAIDQWGRRITLNESFASSCFKNFKRGNEYFKSSILNYLIDIHPNLYSFKITQTNFLFMKIYLSVSL